MSTQQNVAHGHEEFHVILEIPNWPKRGVVNTAFLREKLQFAKVREFLADAPANLFLPSRLDRRLVIKSDRVFDPKSLEHWTPETYGKARLAVQVEPGIKAFTSILFDVSGPGDRIGTVKVSILDLRQFLMNDTVYGPYSAIRIGEQPVDTVVDYCGNILVGEPCHKPNVAQYGEGPTGVLTWFGNLLADPTVFEHIDLTQSLEYLE
jgi:hypothetical protein